MTRFAFRFSRWHRVLGAPFGITPDTTMVEVGDERLTARFGPWVVETPVANIAGVEETGPFALLKTAGPARLSLADGGLTMATNVDRGLCLRFHTPVRGIDPFGWTRHSALTVTVEPLDALRRIVGKGVRSSDAAAKVDRVTAESAWQTVGRWARWLSGMALAVVRYVASADEVRRSFETRRGPAPEFEPVDRSGGLQPIEAGVGPVYERVYRVTIASSGLTPEKLFARVASNLNAVSPTEIVEFVDGGSQDDTLTVGQEYRVRMPGPWKARVRVVERGPTSLRFATLKGHMEAGEIEFSTDWAEGAQLAYPEVSLVFQIHSIARSGDRGFRLLYRLFSLGARMQEHVWIHMCRRVAKMGGGGREPALEVHTIRYER